MTSRTSTTFDDRLRLIIRRKPRGVAGSAGQPQTARRGLFRMP
jgi:hypothetical protein